jgi:proline iminopeptidase
METHVSRASTDTDALAFPGRAIALALACMVAALLGLLSVRLMPHGPATPAQALLTAALAMSIGLMAGWIVRPRWVFVLMPAVHILAIEYARSGMAGPSVGPIRLDTMFGWLALVLGRGVYALVALAPLVFGLWVGMRLAESKSRPTSTAGRASFALAGIAMSAMVVALAIPGRTPPITGANSLAALERITLGGVDQWIMIRAHDVNKPVLLYLSGGPGQSDLAYSRVLFDKLSEDFVVVGWDQRGTGKSYTALDPVESMTVDQLVSDTISLSEMLRERFDERKIYLLGESWGSLLGVRAVQQRPDLYHAWLASGQMVSVRETDRRLYHDTIALARHTGDTALLTTMQRFGEPPYADIPYANATVMNQYDRLYAPYSPPESTVLRLANAGLGPYGVLGQEYALIEKFNVLRGLIDMFSIVYPQLQSLDLRVDVTRLDVPVYIFDGRAELPARRDLMLEWSKALDAPSLRIFSFDNAAHSVAFEQVDAFHARMIDTVVPETYDGPDNWRRP